MSGSRYMMARYVSSPSHQFSNGDLAGPHPLKNGKDHDHEYNPDGETAAASPELPKIWTIEDPFQFAPPKPDRDPWMLLLEPLLKDDQKRCDSWRDEVQNLLIFAGLFSAVVTSFIIQSYQSLQQDPNATMITLLSHIAARLDAPLAPSSNISTSSQPPSISIPPFSPSSSSIRVNALWFTSLVLSLTTVLIGTISLQWLREHQTYSDLSPREMYAVYHMRYTSFNRWHVDKIFSAMPLLLQSALVLFLIGIFDFLRTLGQWAVTAPVAVFMALTFLFLVGTAVLPSLHTLGLYFNFSDVWGKGKRKSYVEPPSPCPYKSPQSHAVRAIVGPLFGLFDKLYPRVKELLSRTRKFVWRAKRTFVKKWKQTRRPTPETAEEGEKEVVEGDDGDEEWMGFETFTRYLLFASWKRRWVDFDVGWLAIRDGFMRRAYAHGVWFECIGSRDDEIAPLFDVVHGLKGQNYQRATSAAAYACFVEISEETLRPLQSRDPQYRNVPEQRFHQSAYLHDVLEHSVGLMDVFSVDESVWDTSPDSRKNLDTLHQLLHQQNLHNFMDTHYFSEGTLLSNHRKELSLRLSTYIYTSEMKVRSDIDTKQSLEEIRFPTSLTFNPFEALLEPEAQGDAFIVIAWQTANTMLSILQIIDSHTPGERSPSEAPTLLPNSILLNPLIQRAGIPGFIQGAAYFAGHTKRAAPINHHEDDTLYRGIAAKIEETFAFIIDSLQREIRSWPTAQGSGPSLLFYVTSLYASTLKRYAARWEKDTKFTEMVVVICRYKRRTVDMGVNDRALEERLAEDKTKWPVWETNKPFSEPWWEHFESMARHLAQLASGGEGPREDVDIRYGIDPEGKDDAIVIYYPFDGPQM